MFSPHFFCHINTSICIYLTPHYQHLNFYIKQCLPTDVAMVTDAKWWHLHIGKQWKFMYVHSAFCHLIKTLWSNHFIIRLYDQTFYNQIGVESNWVYVCLRGYYYYYYYFLCLLIIAMFATNRQKGLLTWICLRSPVLPWVKTPHTSPQSVVPSYWLCDFHMPWSPPNSDQRWLQFKANNVY